MRRFEFTEGTSSKFWEIEMEGTGFTVRFGRIGTAGQTQQKSFPTTAKAQAEHDKLVAEKVKKGYVEVGAAAGAQASPAPAPAPKKVAAKAPKAAPAPEPEAAGPAAAAPPERAPEPVVPEGPIVWTETLLRRVHPRRGGVRVPVRPLLSPKKAWATVREQFQKRSPPALYLKKKSELAAELDAVEERIEGAEPALGTPDEDAVLLAILQHKSDYNDRPHVDAAVDLLYALGGPVHATKAVLGSLGLCVQRASSGGASGPAREPILMRGAEQVWWAQLSRGELCGLPRLRALLAAEADDAGYAAARDAAAPIRQGGLAEQRAGATFLFPTEPDWVQADAEAFEKGGELDLVVCCVSTRAALERVTPKLNAYWFLGEKKDYLATALDGVGPDLVVALRKLGEVAEGMSAELRRAWAELLGAIDTDEAAGLLFSMQEKEVLPFINEAAVRRPGRALRLLGELATARGKAGDVPRAVLAHLLLRAPAAVDAELPKLSEGVRKVVTSLQQQAGPDVPDAPADRLPPVLANPPWASKRAPAALPVLGDVTVPEVPDAVKWVGDERERWRQMKGYFDYNERYDTFSEEDFAEKGRQLRDASVLHPSFFAYAPEALARQHLHAVKFDAWGAADWIPAIVSRFELGALGAALGYAQLSGGTGFGVLLPLGASRLAPVMMDAFAHSKKARADARAWLLRHPEHAAAGLLPIALGPQGKEKQAACAALRLLATNGHEATVLDVAGRASAQARAAVAEVLAFDPVQLYPARLPKLPAFFDANALPRPLLKDRSARLPATAVEALGTMLAFSTLDNPYAGLAQVKEACDAQSLARFAWALFEAWMIAGAPSKENWAFLALGVFGDDDAARKLAPLIREWPGEAAHARAVLGLDVLAAIGTDVTLMHLNGIAAKVKFKGLQQKAQEKIAQLAEERGLTREELADRLVPDLGLDESGSLKLDFGERAFTVGFDELLRPFVKDAEGTRLKDLPKPNKKDDAEKAQAAEERWKALKKDAKAAAGIQILRLELAMCARRRWSPEVFRSFFVDHPLLVHVVRRLVWGAYGADDTLLATFRVAEDRSFADPNDDAWELLPDAKVGLPHALELDEATAARWGQAFSDYEIIQPFQQLGRQTFAPTEAERVATELERVKGLKVPTGKVLGLEARGWRRGPPQDGGVACWMEKPLGSGEVVQLDLDPGLFTGMLAESPEQTLGTVTVGPANTWRRVVLVELGCLAPVVFSELVRDLEGLRP